MMTPKIIFESERLFVRHYTKNDRDEFFRMNGDEDIVRYIRPAKSMEESCQFLDEVIMYSEENPLYGRWAVIEKESSSFAGTFAVIPVENSDKMQLGYSFLKSRWGRGYATEITLAGLHYVFNRTPLTIIYAITESLHAASQNVLKKSGFVYSDTRSDSGKTLYEFHFKKEWLIK